MWNKLWYNPVSEYQKSWKARLEREKTESMRRRMSHDSYHVEVERVERFENVKYYADVCMKCGVTAIESEFFKGWDQPGDGQYLRSIDTNDVEFIGNKAFLGCRELTAVKLHEGLTKIGIRAFENCDSLTSIIIPNSVTEIGSGAFLGCSRLVNVTAPERFLTSEYFPVAIRFAHRRNHKCQYCGGEFTGIFTKICSECDREKDY